MEQIAEEELDACLGYQLTRARAHGRVKASCHRDISWISTRITVAHIKEHRFISIVLSAQTVRGARICVDLGMEGAQTRELRHFRGIDASILSVCTSVSSKITLTPPGSL